MASSRPDAVRSRAERRRDTEDRLADDVDVWVATASPIASEPMTESGTGSPYLVPLSFEWDGESLLLSTSRDSPTVRNLVAAPRVRLALGGTRDVTMIDGTVEVLPMDAVTPVRAERFAGRTGFDPRPLTTTYVWIRVTPSRIQAWREENELAGRELMRGGRWLI